MKVNYALRCRNHGISRGEGLTRSWLILGIQIPPAYSITSKAEY